MRVLLIAECPFTMPYRPDAFQTDQLRLARPVRLARAEAPDLGADQGLRQVDSREMASHTARGAFADFGYRFSGSKSFTWVETSRHCDKD